MLFCNAFRADRAFRIFSRWFGVKSHSDILPGNNLPNGIPERIRATYSSTAASATGVFIARRFSVIRAVWKVQSDDRTWEVRFRNPLIRQSNAAQRHTRRSAVRTFVLLHAALVVTRDVKKLRTGITQM